MMENITITDDAFSKYLYLGGVMVKNIMLQISVFGNFKDIAPSQDNLTSLIKELNGFLPVTSKVFNVNAVSGEMESLDRIQMNNDSTGWRIEFQIERINVVYTSAVSSSDNYNYAEVIQTGVKYLEIAINALQLSKMYTRLAIYSQFINPIGDKKIAIPFFGKLPAYVRNYNELSEWEILMNKNGIFERNNEETTNEIITYSLKTLINDLSKYAVLVTTDINTSQHKMTERFTIQDMTDFSSYAIMRMDTMLSNIEKDVCYE